MASKVYDFTLPATLGASQRFDVRGNYCKLVGSTGAIIVKADTGEEWALLAGQGFRLPESRPFGALTIRNATGWACEGTIFIGDSFFEDSRIAGSVFVIDQSADKTTAGSQFLFSVGGAASAGQGSLSGIRSTTKPCVIKQVVLSSSTSGLLQLAFGSARPTLNLNFTPNNGINKSAGGALSTAEAVRGNSAAAFPTTAELPGAVAIIGFSVQASIPFTFTFSTPILLPLGWCMVLCGNALNRDLVFACEFEEV